MIRYDVKFLDAKRNFFNPDSVLRRIDQATAKQLTVAGRFTRRSAQLSMRRRGQPSPPGRPPNVHVGLLRKFIFYSYDDKNKTVVIGPVKLSNRSYVPEVHEHGGEVRVMYKSGPKTLHYPKRPYMRPAFDKARKDLMTKYAIKI